LTNTEKETVMIEYYEYQALNERQWNTPEYYGGFDPVGDVMIAGQSRDSDALERSNYETIFKFLRESEDQLAKEYPEEFDEAYKANGDELFIYDFRASHWAVGWVETLLMSRYAPDPLQRVVMEVIEQMEEYPCFDEEHYSELEWNEVQEFWARDFSIAERVDLIREHGGNIFAARHDYLNENADPSGSLFDYLRTP
jgi:hypothetical protein